MCSHCSLPTDSKRALKACNTSRGKKSLSKAWLCHSLSFFPLSECLRSAQEAEFRIFRGKNNTLISLVLMLVSSYFFLFSSCQPLLLHTVPQTLTPFSLKWVWNNPCHTVNSGVFKKRCAKHTVWEPEPGRQKVQSGPLDGIIRNRTVNFMSQD